MDNMIAMMSKVDDILATVGNTDAVSLPKIVAIGSQSSGKSSVLENIVGREFLPRKTGLCTRRPLKVELIRTVDGETHSEWAVFHHKPGEIFVDWEEVKKEIEDETERECGSNKAVSRKPISLKFYSPNVLSLTIVDLPGVTRVPVGDQPLDIEKQLTDMIMHYIEKPNTLILAVTPANTDFATSDAINLARVVDPEGHRTLAVITKLDLMDGGTDAMDILCGRVFSVSLGIIGVVCRSQADLNSKKPLEKALQKERAFFQRSYPSLASRSGTFYLRKRLATLLSSHIRDCLPDIAMKINVLRRQFQHQLSSCGKEVKDPVATILDLLTKFACNYKAAIDGTGNVVLQELSGGARINYIFHETFGRTLENVQPLDGLSRLEVLTAIKNSTGPRTAVFVPDSSFEQLVKKQIARLEEPSIRCVELVHEELERIIQHCITKEYLRFPNLIQKIKEVVSAKITGRMEPTKKFIEDLIANELAYINTKHPDFADARQQACSNLLGRQTNGDSSEVAHHKQLARIENGKESGSVSEAGSEVSIGGMSEISEAIPDTETSFVTSSAGLSRQRSRAASISSRNRTQGGNPRLSMREKRECEVVERLIKTYFLIIRKNIQDSVPKAVMNFLVNNVKDSLNGYLVGELYKPDDIGTLLTESVLIAEQRSEFQTMLESYDKASKLLTEVRDSPDGTW
ncbi:unnamed protein product [Oikopleura dioica]|uniref:Uncharacterized protein n=1 Tax=Oikopleura dioica TaxID=34765 RepID=E4Y9Y2_OIKDI|nr:unnamed protein product [Oikopleura dioica]